jgi:hypothetical protein
MTIKEVTNQSFGRGLPNILTSFNTMNQECQCQRLLAHFSECTKNIRAHWFPIVLDESETSNSSSSSGAIEYGLNALLGLDYIMYYAFMKICSLIYSLTQQVRSYD